MDRVAKSRTLQRRITIAYLVLALCACVLFSIIAILAVEGIEEQLVDQRLKSAAAWASPRHIAGLPVEMPAGLIFYHGEDIPPPLRNLAPHVYEKNVDGVYLRLRQGKDEAGDYVVVDRDSDYEKIEAVVYSIVAAGLSGLIVLAVFLGRYTAKRFVTPISELAEAVRHRDSPAALPLLDREDEMGVLARAFAGRTAELNRFLQRERFFTGDVSHELRTPLTVITGAAEILVSRTAERPDLHEPAQRILRAAREAAERVNVLLLLARSPQSIDAPSTPLSPLVRDEVERNRVLCAGKPVELTCDVDNEVIVGARPELLATAVGNLIRNACQYTARGSVHVRVRGHGVTIEDTGPGIPDGVRAKLLDEPNTSPRADTAGTGIGLALTKRICEHLSATFMVATRPAGGTVFSIAFPGPLTKS
jgi:signal transduction histidine kinase